VRSRELRGGLRWLVSVLVAALVGGVFLAAVPAWSDEPSAGGSESAAPETTQPAPAQSVDNAVLRWGLSDEANNMAFAPGTYNFFSAGRIANPGRGGTTVKQSGWKQSSGSVSIEKWLNGSWRAATWAGLSTDTTGKALTSPLSGRFSGHQIVFSDGVGTVDQAAGTAHLTWQGDATVLSYSGMSFFYISDPVLDVADGKGTLTGTLSGYASSQTDTSIWEPVAPTTVTLADLPGVALGKDGFTVTPTYGGSFPKSWVDFMDRLGTGSFWYASGGSTDAYKAALPVTIGYGDTITAPAPTTGATTNADPVENTAPEPPKAPTSSTPTASATSSPTATAPTSELAPDVEGDPGTTTPVAGAPVQQLVQLRAAHVDTSNSADVPDRWWWGTGAVLLALSLLTVVSSLTRPRPR